MRGEPRRRASAEVASCEQPPRGSGSAHPRRAPGPSDSRRQRPHPRRALGAAALALWATACAARRVPPRAAPAIDEITLYRDRALVEHRLELVAPAAGPLTTTLRIAAGVAPDEVAVIDAGGLSLTSIQIAHAGPVRAPAVCSPDRFENDPDLCPPHRTPDPPAEPAPVAPVALDMAPTALAITVDAPRAGRFTIALGYSTDRLAWDAAYTMTASPARDHAVLRGAVAIRNTAGMALHARVFVVDTKLGAWRDRTAALFGSTLLGAPPAAPTDEPALPAPRDVGVLALTDGETRVELLPGDPPRPMRSVLVYDPIGTGLDHPGATPAFDPVMGTGPAPPRITESFEIARDERASRGLPAGPVRLLERRADGGLGVLGESRLYDATSRGAGVDTIAIGTAFGLTGHRERRDWARDVDQKRLSEELLLTIDNARPRPVDVVIREHLYRGQNWTLAYQSAPAAKEGPQQISLRTTVPANGQAKVLYVVVYTW